MSIFGATDRVVAVNVFDISPADDRFTALARDTIDWISYSGLPTNVIERHVRGVRLSRYRAAWQAARACRSDGLLISHLPLMSAAVASAMRLLGKRAPHLAFAFNFTDLPQGRRLDYLRGAFARIDRFTVFSRFEQSLYSQHFGLDPSKITPIPWTQDVPLVQEEPGLPWREPYVCALGGEGRDFAMLLDAVRRIGPGLRVVIIARPHSLVGLEIPDHVEVLTNVTPDRCWRIARDSLGVLVPLKSRRTCCGHITLVGAKQHAIPLATTFSESTVEYVEGRRAVLQCEPGDAAGYAGLIERLVEEQDELRSIAQKEQAAELQRHDRQVWADHLRDFVNAHRAR